MNVIDKSSMQLLPQLKIKYQTFSWASYTTEQMWLERPYSQFISLLIFVILSVTWHKLTDALTTVVIHDEHIHDVWRRFQVQKGSFSAHWPQYQNISVLHFSYRDCQHLAERIHDNGERDLTSFCALFCSYCPTLNVRRQGKKCPGGFYLGISTVLGVR